MLQAVAFGSVHLVQGSSKDHLHFPPVFLGVNQTPKFELETKQENYLGTIHLEGDGPAGLSAPWLSDLCIQPHLCQLSA